MVSRILVCSSFITQGPDCVQLPPCACTCSPYPFAPLSMGFAYNPMFPQQSYSGSIGKFFVWFLFLFFINCFFFLDHSFSGSKIGNSLLPSKNTYFYFPSYFWFFTHHFLCAASPLLPAHSVLCSSNIDSQRQFFALINPVFYLLCIQS